jgi:hypothetical protein
MKRFFAIALAMAPMLCHAQTGTVSGTLAGFDVVNNSGQEAHGFEVQFEGLQANQLYYSVYGGRYGNPQPVPYATGVYQRYQAIYDPNNKTWSATTPLGGSTPTFSWQDCYLGGVGYSTSGCEHFGQSLHPLNSGQTVVVTGRWLVEDIANPGTLIALNPPAAIPFITWFFGLPVPPGGIATSPATGTAPVITAVFEAPEAPEAPEKFGPAKWVKTFITQFDRELTADELSSTNPSVVPESATQVEVAWDIVQKSPPPSVNTKGAPNRGSKSNSGKIAASTRSVIRRYEFYKYTGALDAITNRVICADTVCKVPSAGELGVAVSAQNTAANVIADSITVTRTGNGVVSGASGTISCGNACAAFGKAGTSVTLTASPSGTVFTGWTGPCSDASLTCTFSLAGGMAASATFNNQYSVSVGRSNPGTVTASPAGNDHAIDCGSNCSAKFTDGTVVTFTAVPPAGKSFSNWSGACSAAGTASTCTIPVGGNLSVQAVFNK